MIWVDKQPPLQVLALEQAVNTDEARLYPADAVVHVVPPTVAQLVIAA